MATKRTFRTLRERTQLVQSKATSKSKGSTMAKAAAKCAPGYKRAGKDSRKGKR